MKGENHSAKEIEDGVGANLKSLWANMDFRRLWVGQSISSLGDWLATFALMALVWNRSHSAGAVAGLLVLRILPTAFSGVMTSWIGDRWDRKHILVFCDILRGALILCAAVINSLVYLYILVFCIEFITVTYISTRDAGIPNLVESNGQLTLANSMNMGSAYGSIPISAGIFALLVGRSSPVMSAFEETTFFRNHPYSLSFIVDSLTFFFSALMISRINKPLILNPVKKKIGIGNTKVGSNLLFAFRDPIMRTLTFALATGTLGGGGLFATGVVYVHEVLGGNDTQFGFLMALFGLGMLAGIVGLQFLSKARAKWFIFKLGLLCAGGTLIWMSLVTVMFMAYLAALVFGASFSIIFITGITMVQEIFEDENRGKAFAVFHAISRVFLLLGAALAGALAGTVGDFYLNLRLLRLHVWGVTIAMFASGALIASVSFLPLRRKLDR